MTHKPTDEKTGRSGDAKIPISDPPDLPISQSRRSVLATIVSGGLAALGAALAGLVALVAAPRTKNDKRVWRRAASMFDVPADRPLGAVLAERQSDGWYETYKRRVVFIDRDGDRYRALSATCAHLGCRVHWDQSKKQFLCPCHGGVYDREGRVVAGPPPRGLERLAVRVNPQTSDLEIEV